MIFAFEEEAPKRSIQAEAGKPQVQRAWAIIFALLIQIVAIPTISDPSAVVAKAIILGVTTVLLLWAILPNLRWWAFRILAVGLLLNTVVMLANGGLMPATFEDVAFVGVGDAGERYEIGQTVPGSKNVLVTEENVRLGALSDTFRCPGRWRKCTALEISFSFSDSWCSYLS